MKLSRYDQKRVRVTDIDGLVFRGLGEAYSSEYCMHEYGREEEGLEIDGCIFYERDIAQITLLPSYEEALAAIPPGLYRHFKGTVYEVLTVARDTESDVAAVIYRAADGTGPVWSRPADMWYETVEHGGVKTKRFEKI